MLPDRPSGPGADPPLALLVPLQILHGATYGASHLGAMHFIQARVPEGQAGTAQALYSTVTAGIGMGLAMMFAGFAFERFGGLSYLGMAALGAVSLAAALALGRAIPRVTMLPELLQVWLGLLLVAIFYS